MRQAGRRSTAGLRSPVLHSHTRLAQQHARSPRCQPLASRPVSSPSLSSPVASMQALQAGQRLAGGPPRPQQRQRQQRRPGAAAAAVAPAAAQAATTQPGGLSPQQVAQFHEDGFLAIPGFASQQQASAVGAHADARRAAPTQRTASMCLQVAALMGRANQLVEAFDPASQGSGPSIFTTDEQQKHAEVRARASAQPAGRHGGCAHAGAVMAPGLQARTHARVARACLQPHTHQCINTQAAYALGRDTLRPRSHRIHVCITQHRRPQCTAPQDAYFLDSASNISFFWEEKAFDAAGRLSAPKALAINKIGHAMHDLDPAFREFTRAPAMAALLRRCERMRCARARAALLCAWQRRCEAAMRTCTDCTLQTCKHSHLPGCFSCCCASVSPQPGLCAAAACAVDVHLQAALHRRRGGEQPAAAGAAAPCCSASLIGTCVCTIATRSRLIPARPCTRHPARRRRTRTRPSCTRRRPPASASGSRSRTQTCPMAASGGSRACTR